MLQGRLECKSILLLIQLCVHRLLDYLLCTLSSVLLLSCYPLSLLVWGQAQSDPVTSHHEKPDSALA